MSTPNKPGTNKTAAATDKKATPSKAETTPAVEKKDAPRGNEDQAADSVKPLPSRRVWPD